LRKVVKYDFDKVIDRRGTNSLKYDFARERGKSDELLPMWVADMDFPAPPEVLADLSRVINHGIFGYSEVKQSYYDALSAWFSSRFGFSFERRDVVKTPGVVFALALSVKAFTEPDDRVIIQTPVYYPFYEVIRQNGRKIIENPLVLRDGRYEIDFDDFERKIKENAVKMFILCSPHNPVGRVWTLNELTKLRDICDKNGVLVVADEIHCDFVRKGFRHTCFGKLSKTCVVATAPSKTFNLAGLHAANIIIKSPGLRAKFKAEIEKVGLSQLNVIGLTACESAYKNGGKWLSELLDVLEDNINTVDSYLKENIPKVKLIAPEGTYLLWLDFREYHLTQESLQRKIEDSARLWLDSGTMFGKGGEGFFRINIACPKATLTEALKRLSEAFQ
jgi:cystathionine beta-lyase